MGSTFSGSAVSDPTIGLLTFTKLRVEIADFVNWSRDATVWTDDEKDRLARIINSGYWQFLYPPVVAGDRCAYRWYFLKPTTTLDTVASTHLYDLPAGFGNLVGDMLYDNQEDISRIIKHVSPGYIDRRRAITDAEARPCYCATRPKNVAQTAQQTMELMLEPTPDDAYTLIYQYDAMVAELSAANDYPLGGQPHAHTILQSCRDLAAQTMNDDTGGREHQLFLERLQASIEYDRRNCPDHLGFNEDGLNRTVVRHGTEFTCSLRHNLGGG